jgi:hypothetical protein
MVKTVGWSRWNGMAMDSNTAQPDRVHTAASVVENLVKWLSTLCANSSAQLGTGEFEFAFGVSAAAHAVRSVDDLHLQRYEAGNEWVGLMDVGLGLASIVGRCVA